MATTELVNVFILIHLLGHAVGEIDISKISVHEVQLAKLQQMPYHLDDVYLLGKTLQWRRLLCTKIRLHSEQIRESVLPPKDTYYYVMEAHVYQLNPAEDKLALQCPTLPPMYISHDWMRDGSNIHSDNHQWHVWLVRPNIDDYEFTSESVSHAYAVKEETLDPKLLSRIHIFDKMSRNTRWYICNKARRRVRYEIKIEEEYLDEGPKFYNFTFADQRTQIIFGIRCFRKPEFYIHTAHEYLDKDNIITIALVQDTAIYEMVSTKNVTIPSK